MKKVHDQDRVRRVELGAMYNILEGILHDVMKDNGLRTQLETEDVTTMNAYESTIEKLQQSISQENCPIVLAG